MHRSMWNLPGPQIEPVSPELVGSFLSTVPPGSPLYMLYVPSKKGSNDFLLNTLMKISSDMEEHCNISCLSFHPVAGSVGISVPCLRIKPMPPAVELRVSTTGPSGNSPWNIMF